MDSTEYLRCIAINAKSAGVYDQENVILPNMFTKHAPDETNVSGSIIFCYIVTYWLSMVQT